MTSPVCTYFFRCTENGLIKIGRSRKVSIRLTEVRNEIRLPVDCLGFVIGDAERWLHCLFSGQRRYGEWFDIDFQKIKEAIHPAEIHHLVTREKREIKGRSVIKPIRFSASMYNEFKRIAASHGQYAGEWIRGAACEKAGIVDDVPHRNGMPVLK